VYKFNKMSTVEFDAEAVEAWVELCKQEGEMRRGGASEDELTAMRWRIIAGMAALLPNMNAEEQANLVSFLLRAQQAPPVEATDPTPASED
jgi:hypothetical protein